MTVEHTTSDIQAGSPNRETTAPDPSPERRAGAAECTGTRFARLRRWLNNKARGVPRTPECPWSTNSRSAFGLPRFVDQLLRAMPGRVSRAQLLTGTIVLAVLLREWINDGTFERLTRPDSLRGLE